MTDPITERLDAMSDWPATIHDYRAVLAALRGVLGYLDGLESSALNERFPGPGKRLIAVIVRQARDRIASALDVTL